jgi:hypothetical protein
LSIFRAAVAHRDAVSDSYGRPEKKMGQADCSACP